jgi:cytochrome c-type biogenesis protein CcmH
MMIWLIFGGMTAAVVAALLVPFLRKTSRPQNFDADFDRAVYRDQLQELERDQGRGLIGATEAEAARNEISRRLLQVAKPNVLARGNRYSLLAVLLVPLIALPVYSKFGSPNAPDVPLQERMKDAIASQDFEALVATVEVHLANDPNDIEGWKVLAPAYRRLQRWADAADAYAKVLQFAPPTAQGIADFGEMLVFANEGMVTDEAQRAFAEALKLDAKNERANYYFAMGQEQEGKAPALTDEQVAAGQAMKTEDQSTMIAGMIDGLEQRLGDSSKDIEGWKKLIRARRVSNAIDKAKTSLDLALNIFKDEPASLEALRGLAKELGIE